MSALLKRVIVAVICVLIAFALIGPLSRIFGFPAAGDVDTVIRVVIAGLAMFYILTGAPF